MIYNKRICFNYDCLGVIVGAEGVGKSRGLLLNMIDFWYRKILKKSIPKYALCTTLKKFSENLGKGDKGDLIALDEAGDTLDTQEYTNKINRALYQAYTVIRERCLFSVVVLPDYFDLNPRFRKRRVRLLIDVYKRVNNICKKCGTEFLGEACTNCKSKRYKKGYVCYKAYNLEKIQQILVLNKDKPLKKLSVGVKPIISGTVEEYAGALTSHYSKLKNIKTSNALEHLKAIASGKGELRICRHDYRYLKKTSVWYCRFCGYETKENPYFIQKREGE